MMILRERPLRILALIAGFLLGGGMAKEIKYDHEGVRQFRRRNLKRISEEAPNNNNSPRMGSKLRPTSSSGQTVKDALSSED